MDDYSKKLENCFDEIMAISKNVLLKKNKEYSNGKDPLHQFKQISKDVDISVEKAWGVTFSKGVGAIYRYIKDADKHTFEEYRDKDKNFQYINENIKTRIVDAINFLVFLYYMIEYDDPNNEKDNDK